MKKLSYILVWVKFNTTREQNMILTLTEEDDSEKLLDVKMGIWV